MSEQKEHKKEAALYPNHFEVASSAYQRFVGRVRIISALLMLLLGAKLAGYCCPRADSADEITMALLVMAVFFPIGLYLFVIAIRYDFGKRIIVDGDTLTVNGRSWQRGCLKRLVCLESVSRSCGGWSISNRRYAVYDDRGKTVCRVRENFLNYTWFYHWLMQGGCEFTYNEVPF